MNVRTFLLSLCALAAFLLGAPALASAQTTDRISKLDILVWPEFDDPRVLVQYDGELSTTGAYPREVAFYIPSGASLAATAYADESNQLFNTDPAKVTDAGNGFSRVTFSIPKSHFHVEFYHDAIKGTPDKSLDFVYKAVLPSEQVRLEVQQPLKAENFATDPVAALQSDGMHDFKYHIFNYPSLASDQLLEVKVTYTKTDPNPSLQNVVPPETAPATAPEAAAGDPNQVYILAGIGVAFALGLLALWMWFSRRQPRFALALGNGGSGTSRKGEKPGGGFCGQCGYGLRASDNFCPRCGTKRKQ